MTGAMAVLGLTLKGQRCAMAQFLEIPILSRKQDYSSHTLVYEITQPIESSVP